MDPPERDFKPECEHDHAALSYEMRFDPFSSDELFHDAVGGFQPFDLVPQKGNVVIRRSQSVLFQQNAKK